MSLEKYKEKLQKMKVASAFGMPHEAATALIDAHLKAIEELISAKNHARHIIEMAQKDGWTSNELEFGCSLLEINIEKTLSQITGGEK